MKANADPQAKRRVSSYEQQIFLPTNLLITILLTPVKALDTRNRNADKPLIFISTRLETTLATNYTEYNNFKLLFQDIRTYLQPTVYMHERHKLPYLIPKTNMQLITHSNN